MGVPSHLVYGNACADFLADMAAVKAALLPEIVAPALEMLGLLPLLQRRLSYILKHVSKHEIVSHERVAELHDTRLTPDVTVTEDPGVYGHLVRHDALGAFCAECGTKPPTLLLMTGCRLNAGL